MSATRITLTRYLLMQHQAHPGATGEFSVLSSQIALAAKMIARELSRAGRGQHLGASGEINIQGEATQNLHRRVPLLIGSREDVERAESFYH
ncbi:MAG: hypothetical protein NZ578_13670, partial [Candidatus Binatia bacterium]|nr:hypothetical protein [Candidatus Binatia bacterium]